MIEITQHTLSWPWSLMLIVHVYICLYRITLNWIGKKGESIKTDGAVGENILEAAHRHDIELEGKKNNKAEPSNVTCIDQ